MEERERNYKDECGDHGGRNAQGEPCGRAAGWGTPDASGRCRRHRGTSPDGSSHEGNDFAEGNDGGAPEDNGNAEEHGLRSDGRKWFERHREEAEADVRMMVAGWMEHAPFGWDVYGNVRLLVDAAINECQVRRGDEYIREEGLIVEGFDGVANDGRDITERKENPALMAKSRLQRDTVRILDKLDIINDDADADVTVNVHEELLDGTKAAHQD